MRALLLDRPGVRELTDGRGVDAIVDTLGSDSAIAGRPDWSAVPEFTTAPSVHEIALGAAHSHGDPVARSHLAEVPAALARLAPRHGRGKTVYAEDAASGR
jgi:hypothetical protein